MKKYERRLKDIPELVERLREEKARQKDYVATQGSIEMVRSLPEGDMGGKIELKLKRTVYKCGCGFQTMNDGLMLSHEQETGHMGSTDESGDLLFGLLDQTHQQLAEKTGIPKPYYDRMLGGDLLDKRCLTDNVNHWLHDDKRAAVKKRLIRCVDGVVRAFLGARYRPISHLDLVTTAVQVITGKINTEGQNWAKGARCFDWSLSSKNLDLCLVNPNIGVDLNHLDNGYVGFGPEDLGEDGFYRGKKDEGTHWVFPCERHRNSETGHGSMSVSGMLLEGFCMNGSVFGAQVSQIHVGKEVDEVSLWSADTLKKMNSVIFGQVRDITAKMFDPMGFLEVCRRFKGLEQVELRDAKIATEHLVELSGLTEEVRDEIMEAYLTETLHRGNLFDLQRGVTAAAHAFRETKPEISQSLENLGGQIIEQGSKILAIA